MDEVLIARGFWGPRRESADQVAEKVAAFLAGLDDVVGESVRWSSHGLPGDSEAPHLGISQVYRGAGQRLEKVALTMNAGGWSDSPKVRNGVVVRWAGVDAAGLAGPILEQLVSVWDPDWAAVTSRSLMDALADVQPAGEAGPKAGYLNYLSQGSAQALPVGVDQHLLDNGGVLIGSGEKAGFLAVDKVRELAEVLRLSAAPPSHGEFRA